MPRVNWEISDDLVSTIERVWREDANCINAEPTLFDYLDDNETADERVGRVLEAKTFCLTCPVVVECLTEALDNHYLGVWGGQYLVSERRKNRLGRPPKNA